MFGKIKDSATALAATTYLQNRLGSAGTVQKLSINSQNKSASLTIDLLGEPTPFLLEVEQYSLEDYSTYYLLKILKFRSNKPWLEQLFSMHLADQGVRIPSSVGKLLS